MLEALYGFPSGIGIHATRFDSRDYPVGRQPKLLAALDQVAQKLKSTLHVHDPRLARIQLHAQLAQNPTSRINRRTRLRRRRAGNHPVVCKPRNLIPPAPHLPIKRCQKNVTEQGRDYPAFRSPALTGEELPLAIASGLEHRAYQAQHPTIRYSLGNQGEKFLVVYRPKKILQICIHNPLAPVVNLPPDLAHGVLRRSPSPISEVGFIEYRLEDRLQPVEQRLLAYPVVNRGDSQLTKLTRLARLRDLYLPYRLRLVGVAFQLALQPIQLLIQLRGKLFQVLPIHASTTPIGLYLLPGHLQVLPLIHLVHQRVDLPCTCWVDPFRQSPRTGMYGYFTHRTDPPPRPCSSGFLSLPNRLRLPPSPAHFRRRFLGRPAFGCASDTMRQSDY